MEQLAQFVPFILLLGIMYVALFLPQQRRNREHRDLLNSLEVGDEVVLNSGIHGFVSAIDNQILWLEVADKVELKVSRSAVATKVTDPDDAEAEGEED
jgi:preprotein translocase subunit YajC